MCINEQRLRVRGTSMCKHCMQIGVTRRCLLSQPGLKRSTFLSWVNGYDRNVGLLRPGCDNKQRRVTPICMQCLHALTLADTDTGYLTPLHCLYNVTVVSWWDRMFICCEMEINSVVLCVKMPCKLLALEIIMFRVTSWSSGLRRDELLCVCRRFRRTYWLRVYNNAMAVSASSFFLVAETPGQDACETAILRGSQ
jgi:hypothetical protein